MDEPSRPDFRTYRSIGPDPINIDIDRFVSDIEAHRIAWCGEGIEHDVMLVLHFVGGLEVTAFLAGAEVDDLAALFAAELAGAADEIYDAIEFAREHEALAAEICDAVHGDQGPGDDRDFT